MALIAISAAGACAVIADNKAWRNASLKADVAVTLRQPLVGRRGAVGELRLTVHQYRSWPRLTLAIASAPSVHFGHAAPNSALLKP